MDTSSTDIVKMLRIPIIEIGLDAHVVDFQRQKAADEIVKLRAALFHVQNWLQDAHLVIDKSITETVEALGDE